MYIKVINGATENYTIGQLRKDNPNVSFPRIISDETLAEYDVYRVSVTEAPSVDKRTEKATQDTQATSVNGAWLYAWTVSQKTSEEISEYDALISKSVRSKRDELLAQSDWVTVKAVDQNAADNLGIQVPQAWLDYRQALRDITAQDGFPHNVIWPEVQ